VEDVRRAFEQAVFRILEKVCFVGVEKQLSSAAEAALSAGCYVGAEAPTP
jgi:hypothetical protein